jgi:hypothetical protein
MSPRTIATLVAGIFAVGLLARYLTTPTTYPLLDLAEIDREGLFRQGEQLLEQSALWSADRTAASIVLASSLEPFEVRAVSYQVDVEADFEKVVEYVKNMSYCGEKTRESKDKFEETLYEKNHGDSNHEWVRRSVHVSPPPGSNRDAVVVYFEDRPDPTTYRIGFRSVDRMDGRDIPTVEGASRFLVNPAIYKVEQTAPGKVRIRKVEAVDPQGFVGPLLNNYFISLMFFRNYMFDEAKAMRDALVTVSG